MSDHVDRVLAQWAEQYPGLDSSSMAVIGRIKRLARIVEAEQRAVFGAHDLDAAAFDVLATLRRSPAPHRLTPAELMRSAMVTSGAITQRLDRLEERELVMRTRRPEDGRSVHVSLTQTGRELIDRVLVDHVANQNRLLSGITDEERDRVADSLRGLLESLGDTDRQVRLG
ncbi:MarR family winged helix-turn-helix transcriptional regulator [Streptomyces pratensis]|uniref:MarR family winged helix-turn-helix transcriptional regulator n=1 Tax=Streptomyces pratensis TaxID=1169025 RepID=UPI001934A896|nr:MarR family transcriptional regulator [Streptomyces pratensis]